MNLTQILEKFSKYLNQAKVIQFINCALVVDFRNKRLILNNTFLEVFDLKTLEREIYVLYKNIDEERFIIEENGKILTLMFEYEDVKNKTIENYLVELEVK